MKQLLLLILLSSVSYMLFGQNIKENSIYTLADLSQEPIAVVNEIFPSSSNEVEDTTFTIYDQASIRLKTYFVNGDKYDNIFNPNPTGILIGNQYFLFYCSIERSIRQNFANVLEAIEFEYLSKRYIVLINFREDCLGAGCSYRCYNLFDITDNNRITQVSFSSIFQGMDTFGEFNNDGVLDFIRLAPKPPKKKSGSMTYFLITAYSPRGSSARQLLNTDGHAYYLYARAQDEAITNFKVLQADWFFDVRDTSGNITASAAYFAPYISFDPLYRHLYNPEGVRVEKNRYTVYLDKFSDIEAAQGYCKQLLQHFEKVYIMVDQYSGNIEFEVFIGNFRTKNTAEDYRVKGRTLGYEGRIINFARSY